jgi:CubicO group peptidase (beta-lactamase class C family)
MANTCYTPARDLHKRIVPTVDDRRFRKRTIQGEVHDENAFVWGGVAGHAGIFATATDVATFAECMLRDGSPIFAKETLHLFTTRQSSPNGTSRALGWDTPSSPSQSGRYFSPRSYGHLGYTGTSLWIDPDRGLSVTLLTNRVWPDCSSDAIRQVRPAIHDAIIEGLET